MDEPRPLNGPFRGRRVSGLQVSAAVRASLREAGLTGLDVRPAAPDVPFAGSARPDPLSHLPDLPPL